MLSLLLPCCSLHLSYLSQISNNRLLHKLCPHDFPASLLPIFWVSASSCHSGSDQAKPVCSRLSAIVRYKVPKTIPSPLSPDIVMNLQSCSNRYTTNLQCICLAQLGRLHNPPTVCGTILTWNSQQFWQVHQGFHGSTTRHCRLTIFVAQQSFMWDYEQLW